MIVRKLRTAMRMRQADRRLVAEAVVALLMARLRSGLLPFKILARQLGGLVPPQTPSSSPPILSPDDEAIVRAVRWSIGAAVPWMPFRAVCLQQAIAARTMLARRGVGSILHLGVDTSTGATLTAHAWLDAGGLKVTGYPVDPALAEVGQFV